MAEIEFWRQALDYLNAGESGMLCSVAERRGSSPGKPGALMLVGQQGIVAGTVGGGLAEDAVVALARDELASGRPGCRLLDQHHQAGAPAASGMICGGRSRLALTPLQPLHRLRVQRLLESLQHGYPTTWRQSPAGWELLEEAASPGLRLEGAQWSYVQISGATYTVYLVGGGHVSLALTRVLAPLDFRVVVFEERNAVPTWEGNTVAHEKHQLPYERLASLIPEGARHFVGIMTHAPERDAACLKALAGRRYGYLGLLGSRHKIGQLLHGRPAAGLHAPMGIAIGSQSPEEIAVSIAAEMIRLRNMPR